MLQTTSTLWISRSVYADVCWLMLTYADVCRRHQHYGSPDQQWGVFRSNCTSLYVFGVAPCPQGACVCVCVCMYVCVCVRERERESERARELIMTGWCASVCVFSVCVCVCVNHDVCVSVCVHHDFPACNELLPTASVPTGKCWHALLAADMADMLYFLLTCFTFQRAMNCYLGGMNGESADWGTAGMCPHTTICVLIILYMCPHTFIFFSSYYYIYRSSYIHGILFSYIKLHVKMSQRLIFFSPWISSAQLLHECLELRPDDGPCKAILSYVESNALADGRAPSSWQGFRALTEKWKNTSIPVLSQMLSFSPL